MFGDDHDEQSAASIREDRAGVRSNAALYCRKIAWVKVG
jgi:hypothetical protein